MNHSATMSGTAGAEAGPLKRLADGLLARVDKATRPAACGPQAVHQLGESRGLVALVGAGPGDPELLTLGAVRRILAADVLVFDHLVSAEILALAPAEAERVYVGKESGAHTLPQEAINALLARLALEQKRVVRLKGGDPFVFGRGGEELDALVAQQIPFEVVPGVTAACGVAAYAGIPLTHRDLAQSVVFATGHAKPGGPDADWVALARPRQTAVIYMGVGALPAICERLVANGRHAETPAAVVENGTTKAQRTIAGTLASLPAIARAANVKPPALLIVGEVVSLHGRLGWLEAQRARTATTA